VQKPKAYRENKLSAQADECIYLGQARYHTGNIFMSLTTGKIFTSGVAASGFPPLRKIPHCCLP